MSEDLPDLVEVDDYPGEDFVARWKTYLDAVYAIYHREVARSGLTFQGLPVRCRFMPETFGKHFAFWHIMQEGRIEDDRTADPERCKRVRWIAWTIAASEAGDARVKVFPQLKRGTEQPWALWLEDAGYMVILAERNGYFLLRTAFPVTYRNKAEELRRDWLRHAHGR